MIKYVQVPFISNCSYFIGGMIFMEEVVQFVAQLAAMGRKSINVDEIKRTKAVDAKRYDFLKSIWKKRRHRKKQ